MNAHEDRQSRFDADPLGAMLGLITRLELHIAALQSVLVEKGVLTAEEVTARHTRIFAVRAEDIYEGNRAWLTSPEGDAPPSSSEPPPTG